MGDIATEREAEANERSGLDRRTLIKRAAVVGAVAWTAPAIVGSVQAAGAVGTCNCIWAVKVNSGGSCESSCSAVGNFECGKPTGVCGTDYNTAACGSAPCPVLVQNGNNTSWRITIPASCTWISGFAKTGNACFAPASNNGTIVIFTPGGGQQISHLEIQLCCN